MYTLQQYAAAERLEKHLGNPSDNANVFSFKKVSELDEAEAYPHEIFEVLHQWGLQAHYVPEANGGKLASLEELLAICRVLARRDLTVAVASGVSFLGSLPVWLGGTEAQQKRTADLLLSGDKLSFAVSEKDHGHDILADETVAWKADGGYRMNGEKWTIGNGTLSKAMSVYSKTDPNGGPRGYSVLFVDKATLPAGALEPLPKIRTLGLRGHDLSGFKLTDCPVPADSLIGREGDGFEFVNKSLLVTRTLCAGLAQGAGDMALRTLLNFTQQRHLFGRFQLDMPHVQNALVEAYVDLLICDCLVTASSRGWHFITNQMGLWGPIAKYYGPHLIENTIQGLTITHGARSFMREMHEHGMFQKAYRDIPIVSIFEGSAHPQLHSVATQARQVLMSEAKVSDEEMRELQSKIYGLSQPIDEFFDLGRADLHSHGQCYSIQGLELTAEQIRAIAERSGNATHAEISDLVRTLQDQIEQLRSAYASRKPTGEKSTAVLELGRQFTILHTAAVCVHLWVHNQGVIDEFFDRGEWLVLALEKLLNGRIVSRHDPHPEYTVRLTDRLLQLHEDNRMFAIVPISLGRGE